jgi:tetratricopeptide (TPR) repeat protein
MEDVFDSDKYLSQVNSAYDIDPLEGEKVAEEAISVAQKHNDLDLEFEAKILFMRCCSMLNQSEEILVTYPWVLAQMDAYPNRFDESWGLWAYKWVLLALPKFPHISLAQIQSALDDMERRFLKYNRNNASVITYYRANVAQATGNAKALKEHLDKFKKMNRKGESLGDCKACVTDSIGKSYRFIKDYEAALEVVEPILAKKIKCTDVPERTYPNVIMCHFHLGNLPEAQKIYTKYKRHINQHKAQLDDISDVLTYLVLTKRLPKALELFEMKFHFSLNRFALMDNFDYYMGALVLFGQLKLNKTASVKLNMPKNFELYAADNDYSVDLMYNYLMEQATETAEKFDKRNQNTYFAERIVNQLALIGL